MTIPAEIGMSEFVDGAIDPMDPESWTIASIACSILSREISARAVTQRFIDRIERYDPVLRCFNSTFFDRAIEKAEEVDRKIESGEAVGPFAGVPIAIKDNICTDWGRTTCSSRILESFESPYNATAVRRLLDADAIILGKTNLDEFAMGSSCENSAFEPTRNPWDANRVPGGSSGGSAAAVAASLCAGALGSDTGGSVRQPASFCGVVGFKPTYGSVSRHGLVAFASSLDQIGTLARSVADAAILYHRIRGYDPRDSTSNPAANAFEYGELLEPMESLRIGVPKQFREGGNHPAVDRTLEQSIEALRHLGAEIVEIDLQLSKYAIPTYYLVCMGEASSNLARYDGIRYGRRAEIGTDESLEDLYCKSRGEGFGDEVKRRIMVGTFALSAGYHDQFYNRALKVRRLIRQDFDRAFESCDVIIGPTTPTPSFPLGEKTDDPIQMYLCDVYTVSANLAGIPAVSVPAGMDQEGNRPLPIGLQFTGPAFEDGKVLRIARLFENATEWHSMRPDLAKTVGDAVTD